MTLSIEGNDESGYWVNLGPGTLRLSPAYPTATQALSALQYHLRTCGIHGSRITVRT